MLEGIIIGAIGTVFGVATALAVCTGLTWFGLRLDPDVYYIDRLPINVNGGDFVMVALAALMHLHARRRSTRPTPRRSSARSTGLRRRVMTPS